METQDQSQIKKLPLNFEQKGDTFEQVFESETHYVYRRIHAETDYFEVFIKKLVDCAVFDEAKHKLVSSGQKKERYPGEEDFGLWAWCCRNFDNAMEYTKKLTQIMPKAA